MISKILYSRLNKLMEYMLNMATENAVYSMPNKYLVGAMILDKKGIPISYGINKYNKTHPAMASNPHFHEYQTFIHAEIDAIEKISDEKLKNAHSIIVARLGKEKSIVNVNGRYVSKWVPVFRLARPCLGCQYHIYNNTNIKDIYYTNEHGELVMIDPNLSADQSLYVGTNDT